MDIDPEVNINWGMPVRRPLPSAEEAAESSKQQLMEGSGASSEEDWQVGRPSVFSATAFPSYMQCGSLSVLREPV